MQRPRAERHGTATQRALLALWLGACGPQVPTPDGGSNDRACASCHPDHTRDHARSRHGRSAMGELYVALRDRSEPRTRAFCDSCHRPEVGTSEGLSCESCHRAVGNAETANARLLWDRAGPLRGASSSPTVTTGHRTQQHGFLSSSELCGTCHEVRGPGAFRETPYTEWQASPSGRAGETCAQCHGSPTPGRATERPSLPAASDPSAPSPARPRTDHRFIGPDDTDDALRLLSNAAIVSVAREANTAVVTVTSTTAGHSFPTGVRAVREAWIELSVTDARGVSRTLSGALNEDQSFATGEVISRVDFHDELTAGLPTEATIVRTRALSANERRDHRYEIPAGTTRVRARVRYRAQSHALRVALGLSGPTPAPVDVAVSEIVW